MSDFVTELRREVVGAHAQHRVAAVRTRRRRRRPVLAGAVAFAALLVAVVLIARSIPRARATAEPRVVKVVQIGGDPWTARRAGSLWVTEFEGRQVVRIDPDRRKVIGESRLDEGPDDIAADDESVWATARRPSLRTAAVAHRPARDRAWSTRSTADGFGLTAAAPGSPADRRRVRRPHPAGRRPRPAGPLPGVTALAPPDGRCGSLAQDGIGRAHRRGRARSRTAGRGSRPPATTTSVRRSSPTAGRVAASAGQGGSSASRATAWSGCSGSAPRKPILAARATGCGS